VREKRVNVSFAILASAFRRPILLDASHRRGIALPFIAPFPVIGVTCILALHPRRAYATIRSASTLQQLWRTWNRAIIDDAPSKDWFRESDGNDCRIWRAFGVETPVNMEETHGTTQDIRTKEQNSSISRA
jgi:hypothetical protein